MGIEINLCPRTVRQDVPQDTLQLERDISRRCGGDDQNSAREGGPLDPSICRYRRRSSVLQSQAREVRASTAVVCPSSEESIMRSR